MDLFWACEGNECFGGWWMYSPVCNSPRGFSSPVNVSSRLGTSGGVGGPYVPWCWCKTGFGDLYSLGSANTSQARSSPLPDYLASLAGSHQRRLIKTKGAQTDVIKSHCTPWTPWSSPSTLAFPSTCPLMPVGKNTQIWVSAGSVCRSVGRGECLALG